jgi:hypothetical protein
VEDGASTASAMSRIDGRSVGAVLSDLARAGLRPQARSGPRAGFPTFAVPADAAPITADDVARAFDDDA